MKKLLALVFLVLLVFSPLSTVMAFTTNQDENAENPLDINLYLVEYDDADFFGIASLPASDRGYAKNEIVAAVAELIVPPYDIMMDSSFRAFYRYFMLSGENVDFEVAENNITYTGRDDFASLLCGNSFHAQFDTLFVDDNFFIDLLGIQISDKSETYRWLFFAKVTGENASLTATLYDGLEHPDNKFGDSVKLKDKGESIQRTMDDTILNIMKDYDSETQGWIYAVEIRYRDKTARDMFIIHVDEDYRSTGMELMKGEDADRLRVSLGVTPSGELGIHDPNNPAVILTDGNLYDEFMEVYDDIIKGNLGLDYFLLGNYVRDSFFENLRSKNTLAITVDIAPYTRYVAVPTDIVTDPPKTGSSVSYLGFILIALACAGAGYLLFKRRR